MFNASLYDHDFYSGEFISNPQPLYAAMRKLGPVVYLPVHGNFALTQYQSVKMALLDHTIFTSGLGVTADNFS